MTYELKPISVLPGVAPSTDSTPQNTQHYVAADKVRFVDGVPEKIGGWTELNLTGSFDIQGAVRNVYSYVFSGTTYYLVGTHTNLYRIVGQTLFNATPVKTTTDDYTNVLSTNYATLGSNPLSVTSGSPIVTVTDAGHRFRDGDVLNISGATDTGGILAASLNGAKSISNCTTNTYQYNASANATSTATGGGASVVRASRLVSVAHANGFREGDNIVVQDVQNTLGGILPTQIEGIRVVRNVTGTTYDIVSDGFATSSVSSSGGDYKIFPEIDDGQQNSTSGSGYGMGLYGVGLYGVSKESSTPTPPSIWSFDRFGSLVITTRGNQTGLYSWNNTTGTLPALVTNAPTAINYAFVTDNICVTFGASAQPNRVKWSDQGNLTTWTATAQNQAGEDDIEGAGEFISHASVRGANLLFTRQQVYSFRYIGKPFVFETKIVDPSRGLIARNARVVVNGVAYWMGLDNFYQYRGGNVEVTPSNSYGESTMKEYVYDNIDQNNALKSFAWYNSQFNEIWWHYPSLGAQECDRVVRLNVIDRTWTPDTMNRNAGEYPSVLGAFPYLADNSGNILQHENGTDDNGSPLAFSLTTPFFSTESKQTAILGGVYQDNDISTGNINLTINTKRYPNQTADSSTYPITTGNANLIYRKSARYWQYTISGATLGQSWRSGSWMELIKGSGNR
jgi:hypothetical protein